MYTFNFQYKYLVRYVANNCDSEQMVKKPDEEFIRGNVVEFLERLKPSKLTEEVTKEHTPDEWKTGERGKPKAIDIATIDSKGRLGLGIEIKFVSGTEKPGSYIKSIINDILRLRTIQDKEKTKETTRRCILVAGQRSDFRNLFTKHKLNEILRFPGKVWEKWDGSQYAWYKVSLARRKLKPFKKVLEELGFEGDAFHIRIKSVYRPNFSGFLPKDQKPDIENYMDVGMWEVKPQ